MATAKKSVSFAFKSTSVTFVNDGSASAAIINYEGTATGFGTVLGTLTLSGDVQGAESGTSNWVGTAYLDNGDEVQGSSDGFWERSGKHKWRVRGILRTSTGATYTSDGVISLDGRDYKGALAEWA